MAMPLPLMPTTDRVNLRDLPFVTSKSQTQKDFDDAVYAIPQG
jgi:Exoribonuclease R